MTGRERRSAQWVLLGALWVTLGLHSPAAGEELRFAVFGDCRPGSSARFSPVLWRMAQDMAERRPAFVLGTGDYIEGAANTADLLRQYQGFFQGLAPLQSLGRVPVALAPGNHDIMGSRSAHALFIRYFDGSHYSFNRGSCHIIILDTEVPGEQGRIAGAQLAWLRRDLAMNTARLTFVALHRPLYPVDGHRGSSLDEYPRERDALHRLFAQSGVDCVFAGHEHLYNRQRRDGVEYIITGGGGAPLYAKQHEGGFYHYLLVVVEKEGWHVEVRRV